VDGVVQRWVNPVAGLQATAGRSDVIGPGESLERDLSDRTARAIRALRLHAADPMAVADPMQAASILAARAHGHRPPVSPLLTYLSRREQIRDRLSWRRYPWILSVKAEVGDPAYAGPRANWRPREGFWLRSDPTQYAARIMAPALLSAHLQLWSDVARDENQALADRATALLQRSLPVAEDDVAAWIAADDPWRDTFAIWQLTSRPLALAHLRDLVQALANRYGRLALRDGAVRGQRFPFFGDPLVSASAHLALGLWRLGTYPRVLPNLVALVKALRRPSGAWRDANQPDDVLTTLAAADLLTTLDPSFDPEPTIRFMVRRQEPAGWWRALGPEVPWLTASIAEWMRRATSPFAERFAWPHVAPAVRDRTTGLPTIAFFDDITLAIDGLGHLGELPVEVAFLDLAGFGVFNTNHGQVAGDNALRLYAQSLLQIPDALVVRIGGDEIVILGLPTARTLSGQLRSFLARWPGQAEQFGIERGGVVPRVVITTCRMNGLREARHQLGIEIGTLKHAVEHPPPEGVMRRL
jgi:GGDEF domain-containing protein